MYDFTIKLANLNIHVTCLHEYSKNLCKEYIIDTDNIDFNIVMNQELIDEERNIDDGYKYDDPYLESIALYRLIGNVLPNYDGLIAHGACIEYRNKCYMFVAPSGTGKTTHIKLWLKHLNDVKVINGDKPIIRLINNEPIVFGTPYNGKEHMGCNCFSKLDSIIIVNRSDIDSILEVNINDYIQDIINKIYIPNNKVLEVFDLVNVLFKNIKVYVLNCTMSDSAFEVAYKTLVK